MDHKESATGFLVIAATSIIVAISAVTTFGFFSTYFPAFVSSSLLGSSNALWVSGLIGVIVFDLMTVVWLLTFLHRTETSEQRAIALIMVFTCFAFSAIASAAHLYLGASFGVDAGTRETVENAAVIAVICGVVMNFGAWIAYSRYSIESKDKVRAANRRDLIQKAEDVQANYLDGLIAQRVQENLKSRAPELAGIQADRLVAKFTDTELMKYADNKPPAPPSKPTGQPKRSTELTPKRGDQKYKTRYSILTSEDGVDWRTIKQTVDRDQCLAWVDELIKTGRYAAYRNQNGGELKTYSLSDVPLEPNGNGNGR